MSLIVQKFGGTSVADVNHIKNAAAKTAYECKKGHQVIVVVSAMAGVTNRLIELANIITSTHNSREHDVILSSGEQTSAGLMALAIKELGFKASTLLGWQIPIRTNRGHGRARIQQIRTSEIQKLLKNQEVVVVPGFQGLSPDNLVTTLGRGGSDLTAVALAAATKADRCDIFTDVDGVYTSDPRIVNKAQKLNRITYEEMLEMASQGSKVLQARSVELAMNYGVSVHVRSSFADGPGTYIVSEDEIVEKKVVSGISHSDGEAKVTLLRVADRPGVAAAIFGPLSDALINVDMIVQNISEDGKTTDLTFTIDQAELPKTQEILEREKPNIGYDSIISDSNLAKISIVGVGMRSHSGVAQTMFNTLAKKLVNIKVISTSEIKVSVLIDKKHTKSALKALHSAYGLNQKS